MSSSLLFQRTFAIRQGIHSLADCRVGGRIGVGKEDTAMPFPYLKIINLPIICHSGGHGNAVSLPQNHQFSCTRYVTIAQLLVGKRHCRLLFFPPANVRSTSCPPLRRGVRGDLRVMLQRCDRLLMLLVSRFRGRSEK